jgi:SAM-dependent methyltransferase
MCADTSTTLSMPTAAYLSSCPYVVGKVLDAGCGSKPYKRLFPDCEWVGMDARPVGDVGGDVHEIPFPDSSFDTVLCTEVLQLCSWPQVAMKEMARVLKDGGCLVLTVPNTAAEDNESLWSIKVRGVDSLVSMTGLKGVQIGAEGRLFKQEWTDYSRHFKYGISQPKDLEGWLTQMDTRYPSVTIAVARKETEDGDVE